MGKSEHEPMPPAAAIFLLVLLAPVIAIVALIFALVGLIRLVRLLWSCRYAWATAITCRHCRQSIPLVRGWRCGCGFTFVGSVLRLCPVCGTRPVMVRCQTCGMTRKIR